MSEADPLGLRARGYVSPSEVLEKLSVICSPPHYRERPAHGDLKGRFDFWFDGGACSMETGGITTYQFKNGDKVVVYDLCIRPHTLEIVMSFSDGRQVAITQEGLGA